MRIKMKKLKKMINEEIEGSGSKQSAIYNQLHMKFVDVLSDLDDAARTAEGIKEMIRVEQFQKEESGEYSRMLDKIQGTLEHIWNSLGEDSNELFKIRGKI